MKDFKNPWGVGGAYYPSWIGERQKEIAKNIQQITDSSNLFKNNVKKLETGEEDDYYGIDDNPNAPPDVKRAERIKKEIAKLQKANPDKSVMRLQNMVAEKFQNKKWYRGGNVSSDGSAKKRSGGTAWESTTMMVWKVYDYLPTSLFDTDGVAGNRDNFPINEWHTINLDPQGRFVAGTLSGKIEVYFDDKGDPDKLTIEGEGIEPIIFDYGDKYNETDNIRTIEIRAENLRSFLLNVKVEHPEDDSTAHTSDFILKIKSIGGLIGETKEPKMDYFIYKYNYEKK